MVSLEAIINQKRSHFAHDILGLRGMTGGYKPFYGPECMISYLEIYTYILYKVSKSSDPKRA